MNELLKSQRIRYGLIAAGLLILWNIAGWHYADHLYLEEANEQIDLQTRIAQDRADDLADSIERNLNHLHGIPDMLAELIRVKQAVTRFGTNTTPSALPLDTRQANWTTDPILNDLSRYLTLAQTSLNADLIFVLDAAGDCIAASNWDQPGSPIGTNYAEREFFLENRAGRRGMQYAVGKTTHVPGLYFTTPVMVNGQFMGAIVAKSDIPSLSFLTQKLDAFVVDSNGVIILARDKELEMLSLPLSMVDGLSDYERLTRYRRSTFPKLRFKPWSDERLPALMQVQDESVPQVMTARDLPDYGLQVYVENEMPAIEKLQRDYFWFGIILCSLGSVLVLAALASWRQLQSIRQSRELLWKKANFDALTGLPNRDMLRDRLQQEIKKSERSGLPVALFLIDLDQFKEINDTLGHHTGDLLLIETARRLTACVRKSDTVARLGGDEFVIVLPQLVDLANADAIAQKIVQQLTEPFLLQDNKTFISASVGITFYPHDTTDPASMMKNADQAMYAAKEAGRNRYSHFTAALQEAAQKRLHLTNDLRLALDEQQFRVFFQPIVELATNHVHKAEALIRWQHPQRGMVSPFEFIPLAEKTRLIIDIGAWVRQESIRWCQRWQTATPGGFQISINKSPVEFMDENDSGSVDSFIERFQQRGLHGGNFVFEITEGLLLHADRRINDKLVALRDAGIQVSIDDFGTGYSSLSYLKKFDIDYLKIDQSFVRNLSADSDDMALCEAIIVMAHKLGLKVIAEGVETEVQRDLLAAVHCDYAQGYLYSRPIPPEEFERWLIDHNNRL